VSRTLNLGEARSSLSSLVDEAANGAEIIIAKSGRPLARLVPLAAPQARRKRGLLKGRIEVGDDFDAPLPEDIAAAFLAADDPAVYDAG